MQTNGLGQPPRVRGETGVQLLAAAVGDLGEAGQTAEEVRTRRSITPNGSGIVA